MKGNLMAIGIGAFLIALALLVLPASATINTPTVSFDNTQSYTTGTSVSVAVTVSGSSSSATISRLNLKEVDGLTVSDPASGEHTNYVATTSGTTKNFVVTAGTAGTYEIKAYALEQQATSVQESTTDYLTFVDPSVLRVSVDTDPGGNTYTGPDRPYNLQVTIRNPLETAVTTAMNLSYSTTAMNKSSGDPADDTITIPAHQSVTINWSFLSKTVSGTDYGITISLGGVNAHTSTVTVNAPGGDGTTTSGGSGGDGDDTTVSTISSKSWTAIEADTEATMSIDQSNFAPTEISFKLTEAVTSPDMTVNTYTARPSAVTVNAPGETFKYFGITTTNIDDAKVTDAKIKFRVTNTWITDNYIDKNTVALYRLVGAQWNKLTTVYSRVDDTYSYFEAETPGFSYFAVSGERVEGAPTCTAGNKRCTGDKLEQCKADESGWEQVETCTYGCEAGACNLAPGAICTPAAKQCVGSELQECKSDGSTWTTKEVCMGGCNETSLTCNPVTPLNLAEYWWVIVIIVVVVVAVAVFLYLKAGAAG